MSAGCGQHPDGTALPCRACGLLRLDESLRFRDDRDRVGAVEQDAGHTPISETQINATIRVFGDVSDCRVDLSYPSGIRFVRVEVEDGSVVVELNCHEPESIGVAA